LDDAEPARGGEGPADCFCARRQAGDVSERLAWSNERWELTLHTSIKLPIGVNLGPRENCDLLPGCSNCVGRRFSTGRRTSRPSRSMCTARTPSTSLVTC
jgi:hypothetical protein